MVGPSSSCSSSSGVTVPPEVALASQAEAAAAGGANVRRQAGRHAGAAPASLPPSSAALIVRRCFRPEVPTVQSGASDRLLGLEDEDLGCSPGWLAATVANYCPSRAGELPKFLSSKPCE